MKVTPEQIIGEKHIMDLQSKYGHFITQQEVANLKYQ